MGEGGVRYMRREPMRKPRKVRSVTGWSERRQLRAPGSLSAMVSCLACGSGYSIEWNGVGGVAQGKAAGQKRKAREERVR